MIPLCCTEVFNRNKAAESTHWLARRNPAEPDRPLSQGL
jgi:hypothetical protein